MPMKVQNMSTFAAFFIIAASGFTASPTIASGFYHLFIITPLAFIIILLAHLEGYEQARDDYAPGQPIKGHKLYKVVEWLKTPHMGVRGVWFAAGALLIIIVFGRFH